MEFSYSQTENFEMEKLSSDTGYFKKPVEINRGTVSTFGRDWDLSKGDSLALPAILAQSSAKITQINALYRSSLIVVTKRWIRHD